MLVTVQLAARIFVGATSPLQRDRQEEKVRGFRTSKRRGLIEFAALLWNDPAGRLPDG